jgi:putative aldouronate transport system permease protein
LFRLRRDIKLAKNNQQTNDVFVYRKSSLKSRLIKYKYFYLMFLPILIINILFNYVPMLGIRFAFTKYTPFKDPTFIGFDNFKKLFSSPKFFTVFKNTLTLSLGNLLIGTVVTIIFALLVNELYNMFFKSFVQTVLYMPHFISWVVTASIFTLMLSPDNGIINGFLGWFGFEAKYFMIDEKWWTGIFQFIQRWKETGWGTVIYLAALSGINTELYEAASMDGAGRIKQMWHVTIPGILSTILVVFVLNLAKVMNIFESVFVLQNDVVINISEVIKTYTYKVGIQQSDYGYSTAVGLFQSLISLVLVVGANKLSRKIKGEGIL